MYMAEGIFAGLSTNKFYSMVACTFNIAVGSMSDCRSRGDNFELQLGHISMEIDYETISMVILSLPQIRGEKLSVTAGSTCMCTST